MTDYSVCSFCVDFGRQSFCAISIFHCLASAVRTEIVNPYFVASFPMPVLDCVVVVDDECDLTGIKLLFARWFIVPG